MEMGRHEKSGFTPPFFQTREPVVKYLPAHCLTDLVSDLGVSVGETVYEGVLYQRIDILMYTVGMLWDSIAQRWCWLVVKTLILVRSEFSHL